MNKYRSKSQLYQVFLYIHRLPLSGEVIFTEIDIPKLGIHLKRSRKPFNKISNNYIRSYYNPFSDSQKVKRTIEENPECGHVEINHFKLEDSLIDLIQTGDPLNMTLASEILKEKLKNIKIKGLKNFDTI